MAQSKSIFVDLEIDIDLMMEDPKGFEREVHKAADKLVNILDQSNSTGEAKNLARDTALKNREAKIVASKLFKEELAAIDTFAEEADMDTLFHMIDNLKKVVKDLELVFESRAMDTMIMSQASTVDKRMAFDQYRLLREGYEVYRSFVNLMIDDTVNLVPLKAKTGNYGGSTKHSYPAYKINGEIYRSYRAAAKLLGIKEECFNHMDLQERITEDMPVEIVEITL